MELTISNSKNKVELADSVFACEFNEPLIHQVVTAYRAAGRAGTKAQKTRAEVRGGGTKPWKQKGTGRARAGTIRSPIWRTGGVTFAAKPRCFQQKVNKKMYKGAVRSIVSELLRQGRISITAKIEVNAPKTKELLKLLESMNLLDQKVLLITDAMDENLYLASRNLPNIQLVDASAAVSDPVSLVQAQHVIVTEAGVKEIEGLLK